MSNELKIPENKNDISVPDTVGELIKILQQYPKDAGLELYRYAYDSIHFIDFEFANTPGYRGVLQIKFW